MLLWFCHLPQGRRYVTQKELLIHKEPAFDDLGYKTLTVGILSF
jgi:hypothetical protein